MSDNLLNLIQHHEHLSKDDHEKLVKHIKSLPSNTYKSISIRHASARQPHIAKFADPKKSAMTLKVL